MGSNQSGARESISASKNETMTTRRFVPQIFIVLMLLSAASTPALAGTKEQLIQLQTQVQALQDQMARMQQSFDERMGVMRSLVEQSTDKMNQITASIADLQKGLNQQHTDSGARTDQLSGQMQALNDSLDEIKSRMAKITQQLEAMQNAQTNLPAGSAMPPGPGGQPAVQQ